MSTEPTARPSVTLTVATEAQKPLINGLARYYIYDFSEMEPPGSENMELPEEGEFWPLPGFDDFWTHEAFHPLLIRVDGHPAGFALLNTHSHLTGGVIERNMGEFFVMRKHRRQGVAREAVRQVLGAYPGRWEIAVAERNTAAKTFWPQAIAAAPNVSEIVRHQGDGEHWRGPIWSFLSAAL